MEDMYILLYIIILGADWKYDAGGKELNIGGSRAA